LEPKGCALPRRRQLRFPRFDRNYGTLAAVLTNCSSSDEI
jgi:hypothetical protein